jgi:hypothetical protein
VVLDGPGWPVAVGFKRLCIGIGSLDTVLEPLINVVVAGAGVVGAGGLDGLGGLGFLNTHSVRTCAGGYDTFRRERLPRAVDVSPGTLSKEHSALHPLQVTTTRRPELVYDLFSMPQSWGQRVSCPRGSAVWNPVYKMWSAFPLESTGPCCFAQSERTAAAKSVS